MSNSVSFSGSKIFPVVGTMGTISYSLTFNGTAITNTTYTSSATTNATVDVTYSFLFDNSPYSFTVSLTGVEQLFLNNASMSYSVTYPNSITVIQCWLNGASVDYDVSATLQTTNATLNGNQSTLMQVNAINGSGGYSYQWWMSVSGGAYSSISGATSYQYTYTLPTSGFTSGEQITFYCVVTDSNSQSTESNVFTVTVGSFSVTISTESQYLDVSQNVSLYAVVSGGSGSYTYSWEQGSTNLNVNSPLYTFIPDTTGTTTFTVTVTDTSSSAQVSETTGNITVYSAISTSANTNNATLQAGSYITIVLTTTGGSGKFSYAWQDNGSDIGSGSNSLVYTSSTNGVHTIVAVITDNITGNVVLSIPVYITVVGGLTISIGSTLGSAVNYGAKQTIYVNVSGGSGSYNYQWYSNTSDSANGTEVDSTASSYTFVVESSSPLFYYCVVYDNLSGQSATSSVYSISVSSVQVGVLTSPSSFVLEGNTIALSLNVSGGSGSFSYQWYEVEPDGTQIELSATTSYDFVAPQTAGVYTFFVLINDTNTNFSVYSNQLSITVGSFSASISTSNTTVVAGSFINLYVTVVGGTYPLSYQWYIVTTNILATTSSYSTTITETTTYSVEVTDANSNNVTASITITVVPESIAISSNQDYAFNETGSDPVTFTSTASVEWYQNGVSTGTNATTYSFSGVGLAVGSYSFYGMSGSYQTNTISIDVVSTLDVSFDEVVEPIDNTYIVTSTNILPNRGQQFTIYISNNAVRAYTITLTRNINAASNVTFRVAKNDLSSLSLGNLVQFFYRGNLAFTGYIRTITKYSDYEYTVVAYDGLWELAEIIANTVTSTLTSMITTFASQTSLGTSKIQSMVGDTTFTVDFNGKSVMQPILELLSLLNYNLVVDSENNLLLLNYQLSNPSTTLVENTVFVVSSKEYNVVSNYGSVQVEATINNQSYSAYYGAGTPVRNIGSGWLSLPSGTQTQLDTFANNVGSTYSQGQWSVDIITFGYYNLAKLDKEGAPYVYNLQFADGTILNNLILTGMQISQGTVTLIIETYDDTVLQILNTLID